MVYNVALLADPYRGTFKIVDTANDYIEAWRRAAAARRLVPGGIFPGGIFIVLSTETREDPQPRHRESRSNTSIGRGDR